MSTEGLITVYQGKNPIVSIISHYDGYPEGLGADLANFLDGCQLVNGIPGSEPKKGKERFSNGIDCLAAQLVTYLKEDANNAGNIYLTVPVTIEDLANEPYPIPYAYSVKVKGEGLELSVYETTYDDNEPEFRQIFKGSPNEFLTGKKSKAKKKVAAKKRK